MGFSLFFSLLLECAINISFHIRMCTESMHVRYVHVAVLNSNRVNSPYI